MTHMSIALLYNRCRPHPSRRSEKICQSLRTSFTPTPFRSGRLAPLPPPESSEAIRINGHIFENNDAGFALIPHSEAIPRSFSKRSSSSNYSNWLFCAWRTRPRFAFHGVRILRERTMLFFEGNEGVQPIGRKKRVFWSSFTHAHAQHQAFQHFFKGTPER